LRYLLFMIFLFGCSKSVKIEKNITEDDFRKGYEYFEKEKYKNAIKIFQEFFNKNYGSQFIDDAQFYIGECYYRMKDYESALSEFNFLINNFPGSDFIEMAYLRKAQSLERLTPNIQRDQEITKKAIEAYEMFIMRFPNSDSIKIAEEGRRRLTERLNLKQLQTAKLYYKMGKYNSAIIYLNEVISKDSEYKDDALLLLGDCYVKLKDYDKAKEIYASVGDKRRKEADERIKKLK